MGWRKKTVEGFGRTNAAWVATVVSVVLGADAWLDGEPARIVAGWAAATVIAVAAGVWAFPAEARRVFGPPGSPERRRRHLSGTRLARDLGGGLLFGSALAVLLRFGADDPPALGYQILFAVAIGLLYGAMFAWREWRLVGDEDAIVEAAETAIPARSVPQPAAPPPRDRGVDVRRGVVVCVLLAVLGLLAAVQGFLDSDGPQAGVGLGLLIGSTGLLAWVATNERGHL